ncbi:hypothetical protein [Streptomyces bacillaris]|uniref:hypothetical protein n=1 Tax=Streptomyces bacillaris TaxID=68179 RepID=UPI0038303BD9
MTTHDHAAYIRAMVAALRENGIPTIGEPVCYIDPDHGRSAVIALDPAHTRAVYPGLRYVDATEYGLLWSEVLGWNFGPLADGKVTPVISLQSESIELAPAPDDVIDGEWGLLHVFRRPIRMGSKLMLYGQSEADKAQLARTLAAYADSE